MTILYVILAILSLNAIVFVHELFHLWAAKLLKIKATEFAVGMGPSLVAFQHGRFHWFPRKKKHEQLDDTTMSYHLKMIPLGGYVLFGRTSKDQEGKSFVEDYLFVHPPWKRILVAVAGPFGNFVFAFALMMIIFAPIVSWNGNEIQSVVPKSHAESIGLKSGDTILEVNDIPIETVEDIKIAIKNQTKHCILWERNAKTIENCSAYEDPLNDGKIGVNLGIEPINWAEASFKGLLDISHQYFDAFVHTILNIKVENLSGPVGVIDGLSQTMDDFNIYLMYMVLLNIAIATANLLLPITITDGGRIVLDFIAIIIRKHRIPSKYLDLISIGLLIILFVTTLYLDVTRLFS